MILGPNENLHASGHRFQAISRSVRSRRPRSHASPQITRQRMCRMDDSNVGYHLSIQAPVLIFEMDKSELMGPALSVSDGGFKERVGSLELCFLK